MTDADADQPVTKGDAAALTAAVDRLTAKFKWQQRLTAGLIVAFIGMAAALAIGATALVQVRHENACIASLASASAVRTGALAPLATARSDAQEAQQEANSNLLFHAIQTFGLSAAQRQASLAPDVQAFTAAHEAYLTADEAYKQAYAANPPPKAKQFDC